MKNSYGEYKLGDPPDNTPHLNRDFVRRVAEHWGFRLMFEIAGAVCTIGFHLFALTGKEAETRYPGLSEH